MIDKFVCRVSHQASAPGPDIYISQWEITAPDFNMTIHDSCTVVSTGDEIAHQML